MKEKEIVQVTIIDLQRVKKHLLKKWKLLLFPTLIVAVLSAIIIVQIPRYYTTQVMLAPEEDGTSVSSLSDLASSFGFDLGSMTSSDAIYPMLYPDLFESNDFVVGLFDIHVETLDEKVKTTYLDYLQNHQKFAPWDPIFVSIKEFFSSKPKIKKAKGQENVVDPFMLSDSEFQLVEGVKKCIQCSVDKKTNVITINVTDQDPLVCATLADSVCSRLQNFITNYRTSKSRKDYEYYSKLAKEAKYEYDIATAKYSAYCDSHRDAILQAYISERDDLENEMQSKYNAYNLLNTQLQAAKAKIQERTPAFTMLQNASVPTKPEGPKRMIFVVVMTFLAFVVSLSIAISSLLKSNPEETDIEEKNS